MPVSALIWRDAPATVSSREWAGQGGDSGRAATGNILLLLSISSSLPARTLSPFGSENTEGFRWFPTEGFLNSPEDSDAMDASARPARGPLLHAKAVPSIVRRGRRSPRRARLSGGAHGEARAIRQPRDRGAAAGPLFACG